MSESVLSILTICTLLIASLFYPAKAEATELESIYVRVPISPERYQAWLASPLKHAGDFADWAGMTEEWEDDWTDDFYDWDIATNAALVESIQKEMAEPWDDDWNSQPYVSYDAEQGIFRYAQLLYDENYINFTNDLSAFRSLADFKDTDEPGFIVIYPFIWDPGYTVIMELGKGYAKFHTEKTAPPSFKAFIAEANAHFDAELEKLAEAERSE